MAKKIDTSCVRWNYYMYSVIEILNEYESNVLEEFGEHEQRALNALEKYKAEKPDSTIVLQQQHFVSRVIA